MSVTLAQTASIQLVDPVAPPGMLLVVDHDGLPSGYIPVKAMTLDSPAQFVRVGGRTLEGLSVVDSTGRRTGFMLATLGFVDLEVAGDPAAIGDLIADQQRRERESAMILAGRGDTPPSTATP